MCSAGTGYTLSVRAELWRRWNPGGLAAFLPSQQPPRAGSARSSWLRFVSSVAFARRLSWARMFGASLFWVLGRKQEQVRALPGGAAAARGRRGGVGGGGWAVKLNSQESDQPPHSPLLPRHMAQPRVFAKVSMQS